MVLIYTSVRRTGALVDVAERARDLDAAEQIFRRSGTQSCHFSLLHPCVYHVPVMTVYPRADS